MITSKYYCFIFALAILLISYSGYAQIRCGTVEAEQMRREKYDFLPSETEFEKWMSKSIEARRNQLVPFGTKEAGNPDLIAVVVHVVHNGESYGEGVNITDEQIYSQIEVLNEDYQRKNADTVNTQPEFLNVAGRLNIEFVLARQTIDGEPTTGIVRVKGPKASYNISIADRELLSGLSQWDPHAYLNIWVTNLRSPFIGLAQFPDYNLPGLEDEENKDNEATDGMVVDYQAFGSVEKVPGLDLISDYNLGRTSTHEIGHFLGLKHVWGDGDCSVDDYVSDTPNSNKEYSGECPASERFSCESSDMYENYLNYTNDGCMNAFTVGQVTRMEVILTDAPRRASLLNAIGTRYPDDMYFDLAIRSINSPGVVECGLEVQPVIEVKNNGTIPVPAFDIDYYFNETKQTYTYQGDTIFTGEIKEVLLPDHPVEYGTYELLAELNNIPDDVNGSNNKLRKAFAVDNQDDFVPLREQFEISTPDETNWIIVNEDKEIGWELENAPNHRNDNTAMFLNFYNYETRQEIDWLISPSLDFTGAVEASLTFKTSYARNQEFNDQMRIVASSDCGKNFDDLIGILNSSDLSVTSSGKFWEPEDQNDWLDHTINLDDYAGKNNIRIAFQAINDFGNNLYLDDIEFFTVSSDKIVKTAQGSFKVYPNPTGDRHVRMTFNTSRRQDVYVLIYDRMGKLIVSNEYPNTLNQTYHYDLTGYRSGVYFIHSRGEDFMRTKKLIIH
ncbi:MAG: choice-of-anchor J domain-containing protein [Cytophagales bacterium]|nr:choice-of-anchor J domain-containing protein [Cytophagales bacterium]